MRLNSGWARRGLLLCFFAALPAMSASPVPTASLSGAAPSDGMQEAALQTQLLSGGDLLKRGQITAAIDSFDKIISAFERQYPDDSVRRYTSRGMVESLFYMLEAANSKPPKSALVVSLTWSDAIYLKGYSLIELKQPAEARKALEAAVAMAPVNSRYLSELGNLFLASRDWSLAMTNFEKAAAAKEFSPPELRNIELSRAWRGMGYVYIEQARFDDAEKVYRQCLELDRNDQRALSQLAYVGVQRARQQAVLATTLVQSGESAAQIAAPSVPATASPQLLDYLYQQIEQSENSSRPSGAMPAVAQMIQVQAQLRTLGARAWPLAPRMADLLAKSEKNQYSLAWMLVGMVPPQPVDPVSVNASLAKLATSEGADRLVQLAVIGQTVSPSVIPVLQQSAADGAVRVRLLASIGLAYAGRTDVQRAATLLAGQLTDPERVVRSSALNSLRLLGASAEVAVPALVAYLRGGENPWGTTRALKVMPLAYLRELRPDFEKILASTTLSAFQKEDAAAILVRLDTEK